MLLMVLWIRAEPRSEARFGNQREVKDEDRVGRDGLEGLCLYNLISSADERQFLLGERIDL